ncbi:MAG TPA: CtpF protein, partial [Thermopetrobacter sp.]|nr:CtpF protein [Thermopetrobacter sp.]
MNPMHSMPAMPNGGDNVAPLPRITVHAFCETQETASVMQAVAADRRMSRATMHVYTGGIPAAVQAYAQAVTPELVIVESARTGDELMAELASLAQVCAPHTRVIVIGHQNDIQLYRRLI